jgi:hypothetical protein
MLKTKNSSIYFQKIIKGSLKQQKPFKIRFSSRNYKVPKIHKEKTFSSPPST